MAAILAGKGRRESVVRRPGGFKHLPLLRHAGSVYGRGQVDLWRRQIASNQPPFSWIFHFGLAHASSGNDVAEPGHSVCKSLGRKAKNALKIIKLNDYNKGLAI